MKYMKIGLDLFSKRMLLNLLLVIQVAISFVAINVAFARGEALSYDINMFKKSEINTLCVMLPLSNYDIGFNVDFTQVRGSYDIGESRNLFQPDFFDGINITAYSDCLLNNISIPLSKGTWFAKPLTEGGITYYPVVIDKETPGLCYKDKCLSNESADVGLYIAGVLDSPQKYLNLGTAGTYATCSDLMKSSRNSISSIYRNTEFFMLASNVPASFTKSASSSRTKFLFFESDISKEDFDYNIKVLSDKSFVYSIDSLLKNSYVNYNETMRLFLPFCIIIYVIALTGLISFVALNILQNTYFFAVLYLCGCRWKNCRNICLAYIGIISFISLIVSLFLFVLVYFSGALKLMGLYFSIKNVWVTLAVVALMFAIAVAIPFVMMKRFSVSEFIRKYEK